MGGGVVALFFPSWTFAPDASATSCCRTWITPRTWRFCVSTTAPTCCPPTSGTTKPSSDGVFRERPMPESTNRFSSLQHEENWGSHFCYADVLQTFPGDKHAVVCWRSLVFIRGLRYNGTGLFQLMLLRIYIFFKTQNAISHVCIPTKMFLFYCKLT